MRAARTLLPPALAVCCGVMGGFYIFNPAFQDEVKQRQPQRLSTATHANVTGENVYEKDKRQPQPQSN
ncbi:hypothetical protein NKR23_g3940 [Pleurostoma richardsiae]|uniref:Uncharacterized protein n=1 Tax=Pleurostoma richardsiae TaxID=41990 RepID=A0AA38VT08_9PEZI|nr:hypothetical protein NKR23_g3940 [Pleurostoma richardsiae]